MGGIIMEISVTRGLVQLKRLEQRINKKIGGLNNLITVEKKSSKNVKDGLYSKEEFAKLAKSEWASLNDLIALRKEIKDAIVQSNAITKVSICGVQYTVAQAIERKSCIVDFELDMVRKISNVFGTCTSRATTANERVEIDAQRLFGTSTEDKKSEVNRIEMMNLYVDTNSYEIVDPLNFKELKDALDQEVHDFLAEVDQVLSESNAVTMIEISKNPTGIL